MRNTSGLWRGGPGRLPGVPNRATQEVRAFCQHLVADPEYRARFEQRWRSGTLPPALEQMVWAYAVGKPQQSFEISSRGLSLAELIAGPLQPDEDGDDASHKFASAESGINGQNV